MGEPSEKGLLNTVKGLFALTAGIGAVAYLLGFIVINSFFVSQGVVVYNLLSTKYLAAGICFSFFCAVTMLVLAAKFASLTEAWREARRLLKGLEKEIGMGKETMSERAQKGWFVAGFVAGFLRTVRDKGPVLMLLLAFVLYLSKSNLCLFYSGYFYLWAFLAVLLYRFIDECLVREPSVSLAEIARRA